ncbi:uncharacterized protein LOC114451178 [Parambassis ranga]|uniref:Uncharacterized protein LOC114451178 n=1 Tax=Parambassis ranga TaxID=210632 RepID=A0A6P7K812_9TELE|nr:uncharacterized protein LOC114451178 [Parambassis ranga]
MMTSPKFVFYVTCLFLGKLAQKTCQSSSVHLTRKSGFISANVGENVTLRCFYDSQLVARYFWYKQTLGQKPKLISKFYVYDKNATFLDEYKNNPRFSLDTGNGKNHLMILDLQFSDSATYYCASSFSVSFEFREGVTVSIKGSGLNLKPSVSQSVSESLQAGGSVTLNCTVHSETCDGEHSVYWFRHSETSHPGLIYTHGGRNDQCERKPKTQTTNCLYNLPRNVNLSNYDAYCAVASCGHILFGGEKELKDDEVRDGVKSLVLVYFLSGALAFTTILTVVLAFLVFKMNKRSGQDSTGIFSSESTPNTVVCQDGENLHYATALDFKANRSRRKMTTQTECVYSSVRQ